MVGFVKTIERRAVDTKQRRQPVRLLEPVEIDQQAHHAIAETVSDRF
jgi:hypothetical protein